MNKYPKGTVRFESGLIIIPGYLTDLESPEWKEKIKEINKMEQDIKPVPIEEQKGFNEASIQLFLAAWKNPNWSN